MTRLMESSLIIEFRVSLIALHLIFGSCVVVDGVMFKKLLFMRIICIAVIYQKYISNAIHDKYANESTFTVLMYINGELVYTSC